MLLRQLRAPGSDFQIRARRYQPWSSAQSQCLCRLISAIRRASRLVWSKWSNQGPLMCAVMRVDDGYEPLPRTLMYSTPAMDFFVAGRCHSLVFQAARIDIIFQALMTSRRLARSTCPRQLHAQRLLARGSLLYEVPVAPTSDRRHAGGHSIFLERAEDLRRPARLPSTTPVAPRPSVPSAAPGPRRKRAARARFLFPN